ncbi:DUF2325 domain-containing protein (plasmid) [Metabacillus halosaccharovorans]|uniref:DUF2325 domain-containing protein n=1 Tax=Metabacillus halosaccharovorans TaxID=930124 RepID=UPI001C1F95F2|nr:DUF2325 domain-containing protein [Metabacillus halosaccharovorans]MBU7595861.1 DUF2325 domain-containing protein [Metabacillus halosaccharovorans]
MKKTIAIFGGSQELTYRKIGEKNGVNVIFHSGKSRNGGNKKEFRTVIKKADCVVVLLGAVGHVSMDVVKDVAKKLGKTVIYHDGRGATGAIKSCLEFLKSDSTAA